MDARSDLALRLWRDGYRAMARLREDAGGRPAFPARLLGGVALVVRGEQAVRRFYDEEVVRRHGAVPRLLAGLLFGRGAVHGLDDEQHTVRKAMFLELLDEDAVRVLTEDVEARLDRALTGHLQHGSVAVFDLLVQVYGAAVLPWAGTGVQGEQAARLSRELAAIVDGFGGAGMAYPRAWLARLRVDRWATGLIERSRRATPLADRSGGTPLQRVARQTDPGGELLPAHTAAVELVNILRPTVAVAWLGAFAVLALADHPHWRARLADPADDTDRSAFAHEVRRVFPFVPALVGRSRGSLDWDGNPVRPGQRILLDVRGTDVGEDAWEGGGRFEPTRFRGRPPRRDEMVPQGGGPREGHRCPGEPLTQALLETTLRVAAAYDVRPRLQDERDGPHGQARTGPGYREDRIPTRPDLHLVRGGATAAGDTPAPDLHGRGA